MNVCMDCPEARKPGAKRCLSCGLAKSRLDAVEKRKSQKKVPGKDVICKYCGGKFPRVRNAQAFCGKVCKDKFFYDKATKAWLVGKKRGGRTQKDNFGGFIDL